MISPAILKPSLASRWSNRLVTWLFIQISILYKTASFQIKRLSGTDPCGFCGDVCRSKFPHCTLESSLLMSSKCSFWNKFHEQFALDLYLVWNEKKTFWDLSQFLSFALSVLWCWNCKQLYVDIFQISIWRTNHGSQVQVDTVCQGIKETANLVIDRNTFRVHHKGGGGFHAQDALGTCFIPPACAMRNIETTPQNLISRYIQAVAQ